SEVELVGGIEAESLANHLRGLDAICAGHGAGPHVLDDEVMTDAIEAVLVAAGEIGGVESFVHLEIEHLEAKAQHGVEIGLAARKSNAIPPFDERLDVDAFPMHGIRGNTLNERYG